MHFSLSNETFENPKIELPNCFVTDNDEALLGDIKTVFPNSKSILCWIHIQRNFMIW